MKNILTLVFSLFCLAAFAQGGEVELVGWYSVSVFDQISTGDCFVATLGVLFVFFVGWKRESNVLEKEKGTPLSFTKYLKFNFSDGMVSFLGGALMLFMMGEGTGHMIDAFAPDFGGFGEKLTDLAISGLSGILGAKIFEKLV